MLDVDKHCLEKLEITGRHSSKYVFVLLFWLLPDADVKTAMVHLSQRSYQHQFKRKYIPTFQKCAILSSTLILPGLLQFSVIAKFKTVALKARNRLIDQVVAHHQFGVVHFL